MKTFIIIILIHYIADFIFQDESWAIGKSKNIKDLLKHTLMYSLVWYSLLPLYVIFIIGVENYTMWSGTLFVIITFICHTITDYFTSKIVSKKFAKQEYGSPIPNFGAFSLIGLDQVLHYLQLIITYELIFN